LGSFFGGGTWNRALDMAWVSLGPEDNSDRGNGLALPEVFR